MSRTTSPTRSGESLARQLWQEGIRHEGVLKAIANTPRHTFIEQALAHKAYENTALPIGQGQTISQPYIVAKMTELLLQYVAPQRVLEIGTGSGYQTAILAQVFQQVYSVERIKSLQYQAKRRLQKMDLHNISMRHGDGWEGWSSKAPYEAIIVTAAPETIPEQLLLQLADGGVMVIPVGVNEQKLKVVTRNGDKYAAQIVESVRFVPLIAGDVQ